MRTIRRQLTWKVLTAFITALLLGGAAGFLIIRSELQRQFDTALSAQADAVESVTSWDQGRLSIDTSQRFMRPFDAIGELLEISPAPDDPPRAPNGTPRTSGATSRARTRTPAPAASPTVTASVYEIWRADTHEALARSGSLGAAHLAFVDVPVRIGPAAGPRMDSAAGPRFVDITLPDGRPGRAVAVAIRPRMPHEGAGPPLDAVLIVAADRGQLDRTLRTVALVLSGCGLLLIAVTSIAVPRVLRREMAPIDRLADQAASIDACTLSTRFETSTLPGELVPIGSRLNDLLSRLEEAFERERQFSADVAHELRTPIAELRAAAELALKWPDARQPDHDRDTLAIAAQMEGIVTRLLALLRSERGVLPVTHEAIDIVPLVQDIWRPLASRAEEKRLAVTWRLPRDLSIDTDGVLLRSILANVLENAVDYTPPGGAIDIAGDVDEIDSHGHRRANGNGNGPCTCALRITNTVDGLMPGDVPKLFDRFWRRDAARSSVEHSGLGLPLARAFAHALRFELSATLIDQNQRLLLTLQREPSDA